MENFVEDFRQGKKVCQILVESLMKPTDPVKEELRRKTMKMSQLRPQITKITVCTFEMSGKITDSANVASEPVIPTPSHTLFTIFGRASGQIFENKLKICMDSTRPEKIKKKCGFQPFWGWLP